MLECWQLRALQHSSQGGIRVLSEALRLDHPNRAVGCVLTAEPGDEEDVSFSAEDLGALNPASAPALVPRPGRREDKRPKQQPGQQQQALPVEIVPPKAAAALVRFSPPGPPPPRLLPPPRATVT